MRSYKKSLCIVIMLAMLLMMAAACNTQSNETADAATQSAGAAAQTEAGAASSTSSGAQSAADSTALTTPARSLPSSIDTSFLNDGTELSYSAGIDENGYWVGIKALDYVEIFDYKAMSIPFDTTLISDEYIQLEIDNMLESFSSELVMDREIEFGDTVNIDYVGTIDGVEFENGSTDGMGTDVTIGVTSYIDDFLEQLIGYMPGAIVKVEVTFPDDYHESSLRGKDAVFLTVINYIIDRVDIEFNDAFVVENLFDFYGWTTVDETKEGMKSELQSFHVKQYIQRYFSNEVTVRSVPDDLLEYQVKSMIISYQEFADYYNVGIEEYLINFEGLSSVEELVHANLESSYINAEYALIIQAIAEDAALYVNDADILDFFTKYYGTGDYTDFVIQYGMPYVKQIVLGEKVYDLIADNAILT